MEQLLKELTELPGPCGFEHAVIRYLYNRLAPHADEIYIDGIGDLIVTKKGGFDGPTMVTSAHTDEVGFIVKKIEANGLIRFEKLGGHDDRILLSEQVLIHTAKGSLPAVIGTISAHMQKFDNNQTIRNYRQLYMDAGASDAQEAAEMGIAVGDFVTWATPFVKAGPHRVYGHGFDDRCGCAILAKAIEEMDFSQVHGTVHFIFSVQEEVGLRGAKSAAHQLKADVALAVDTTAVSDTPESMMDNTLGLGRGAGIKIMDASMIASPAVWKKLRAIAEEEQIPYQMEIFTGIGTDAGELHTSHGGVPSSVISIPSRSAHSSVELIDMRDFEACYQLFCAFIRNLRTADEFDFLKGM